MKNWLPAGVLAREGHAQGPAAIGPLPDLAAKGVAGTAVAVSPRAAALDHEVRLDPVKGEPVVEAAAGEVDEGLRW